MGSILQEVLQCLLCYLRPGLSSSDGGLQQIPLLDEGGEVLVVISFHSSNKEGRDVSLLQGSDRALVQGLDKGGGVGRQVLHLQSVHLDLFVGGTIVDQDHRQDLVCGILGVKMEKPDLPGTPIYRGIFLSPKNPGKSGFYCILQ